MTEQWLPDGVDVDPDFIVDPTQGADEVDPEGESDELDDGPENLDLNDDDIDTGSVDTDAGVDGDGDNG